MANSLRAELLSIDGIAAADLEGSDDAPQGVRVQLAAGADAESVGREVEKVLANHGMRSHRSADQEEEAELEAAELNAAAKAAPDRPGPPPPPGAGSNGASADVVPIGGAAQRVAAQRAAETWPVLQTEVEPIAARLNSVSVEEGRDGIAVRVVVGDAAVTRHVGTGPEGLDAAIVAALTELLEVEAELIAVQRGDAGEAKIVTVLLEVAGSGQQVGSAVVAAGEAYAVAHAAWKALKAPE